MILRSVYKWVCHGYVLFTMTISLLLIKRLQKYLCILIILVTASVGRYQYFASGIWYYKFKTVFGISQYFGLVQIHKLHLIIGILLHKININRVKLVHKVLVTTLMITWQVKIDVILLFTCSIVIEHKFAAVQLQLCPPLN